MFATISLIIKDFIIGKMIDLFIIVSGQMITYFHKVTTENTDIKSLKVKFLLGASPSRIIYSLEVLNGTHYKTFIHFIEFEFKLNGEVKSSLVAWKPVERKNKVEIILTDPLSESLIKYLKENKIPNLEVKVKLHLEYNTAKTTLEYTQEAITSVV